LVKTDSGLIILRLLAGLAGRFVPSTFPSSPTVLMHTHSAGPSLGGGSIGDMFTREQRGGAQVALSEIPM
jgi:hypothetical protein